ncbi:MULTISPECIES: helix-turn-helix transcriptional regulator [unclassified Streptomyces]|uniref:helix-turn-helix domain-containing protein n=1 Tax=unclassified Streptomyces TaxID=2593676 RepID=UPI002FDC459F
MSSSSSVQQAREALGKRLREIRKDSGLTARDLAARAGRHESKCSRIENGRTPPSDDDLRVYALYCAAADQTADLIATARNIDGAYVEWRRRPADHRPARCRRLAVRGLERPGSHTRRRPLGS